MVNNHKYPLDTVFAALSDPTRRAIIARLDIGPATVSELAAPFAMSLPAVSKHLRVLESAGLVRRRRRGRTQMIRLDPQPMAVAGEWLGKARGFSRGSGDSLAERLVNRRLARELGALLPGAPHGNG
jgi:DNA-binding transcriptional ArsR family regulator